jgi:hypothetical protein
MRKGLCESPQRVGQFLAWGCWFRLRSREVSHEYLNEGIVIRRPTPRGPPRFRSLPRSFESCLTHPAPPFHRPRALAHFIRFSPHNFCVSHLRFAWKDLRKLHDTGRAVPGTAVLRPSSAGPGVARRSSSIPVMALTPASNLRNNAAPPVYISSWCSPILALTPP